jgi:hypothetical protein
VIGEWFHLTSRVKWHNRRIGLKHASSMESQWSETTPHISWDAMAAYLALSSLIPFFPSPSP